MISDSSHCSATKHHKYLAQHTNQNLSGNCKILLSNFKMGEEQPDFGKCESFVWYDFKTGLINLARTINITCFQLLIDGIVYPQIYVTSPMTFFLKQTSAIYLLIVRYKAKVNSNMHYICVIE